MLNNKTWIIAWIVTTLFISELSASLRGNSRKSTSTSKKSASRGGSSRSNTSRSSAKSRSSKSRSKKNTPTRTAASTTEQTTVPPVVTPNTDDSTTTTPATLNEPFVLSEKNTHESNEFIVTDPNSLDAEQLSNLLIVSKVGITQAQLDAAKALIPTLNQHVQIIKPYIKQYTLPPAESEQAIKTIITKLLAFSPQVVDIFSPAAIATVPTGTILSGQQSRGNATEQVIQTALHSVQMEQFIDLVIVTKPWMPQTQLADLQAQIQLLKNDLVSAKTFIQQAQAVPAATQTAIREKADRLLNTNQVELFVPPYKETVTIETTILTGQSANTLRDFITVNSAVELNNLSIDQLSNSAIVAKKGITQQDLSNLQQSITNISILSSQVRDSKAEPYVTNLKNSLSTIINTGKVTVYAPPLPPAQPSSKDALLAKLNAISFPATLTTADIPNINMIVLKITASQRVQNSPDIGLGGRLATEISMLQNKLNTYYIMGKSDTEIIQSTPVTELNQIKDSIVRGVTADVLDIVIK